MYCRDFMIDRKEVVTVTEDYSLANTLKRMDLYGFRALPVSNYGRFVGVINMFDIYQHVYVDRDVNLDRALVSDVMHTDVAYVNGTDVIEVAAKLLTQQRVMFLPVLQDDTKDQFMGIIPVNRLMRIFMSSMGMDYKGNRITVSLDNEKGELSRLLRQLVRAGANIEGLMPIQMSELDGDNLQLRVIVKFDGDMDRVELACQDANIKILTKNAK